MIILVLNSGSSSVKYKLFDISDRGEKLLDRGLVERIGERIASHKDAVNIILKKMTAKVEAVGHRIVHGGDRFKESVSISDDVVKTIGQFSELAPLHNPPSLLTVTESRRILSRIPHVAVFDTAFYQTMPECAYLYAIPYSFYERYKVRRYGFHGTSHRYVASEAACILKRPLGKIRLITCHLGNGCSITAVKNGEAVDTSMGFTPLEGLVMGTRSGDIDPAVVPFIMEKENMDVQGVIDLLNKESGLLGLSGISNDMREIIKAQGSNKKAKLALGIFRYRIKKYIGAYTAVLEGVDAVVFTGGIGENHPELVKEICRGVVPEKVKVLVVPTDEELMIARDTYRVAEAEPQSGRGRTSAYKMKIHVDEIPPDGLELAEQLDPRKISLDLDQQCVNFAKPIDAKAKFTKTGRNVFVDVALETPVEYTCGRCLAKIQDVFKKQFNIVYEVKPGDVLEIDDGIRQEMMLDYPMKIVCKPDCKGLCPNCGQNLNIAECECAKR